MVYLYFRVSHKTNLNLISKLFFSLISLTLTVNPSPLTNLSPEGQTPLYHISYSAKIMSIHKNWQKLTKIDTESLFLVNF